MKKDTKRLEHELVWLDDNGDAYTTSEHIAYCFKLPHDKVLQSLQDFFCEDDEGFKMVFTDTRFPMAILKWKAYWSWSASLYDLSPSGKQDMKCAFWEAEHRKSPKVTGVAKIVKPAETGGSHYDMPIQPIDYIHANSLPFDEGNVVKYISRYKRKNGLDDLRKCLHYVLLAMQREYNFPAGKITKIMEETKC